MIWNFRTNRPHPSECCSGMWIRWIFCWCVRLMQFLLILLFDFALLIFLIIIFNFNLLCNFWWFNGNTPYVLYITYSRVIHIQKNEIIIENYNKFTLSLIFMFNYTFIFILFPIYLTFLRLQLSLLHQFKFKNWIQLWVVYNPRNDICLHVSFTNSDAFAVSFPLLNKTSARGASDCTSQI